MTMAEYNRWHREIDDPKDAPPVGERLALCLAPDDAERYEAVRQAKLAAVPNDRMEGRPSRLSSRACRAVKYSSVRLNGIGVVT